MKSKKKINLFHILALSIALYFLSVGCAFLAGLFEPDGVRSTFEYWQLAKAPSREGFESAERSRLYSGFGALGAIIFGCIVFIIVDRRIGYHWLNSLLAIGVLIGLGFALREIQFSPQMVMIYLSRWLGVTAIPANVGFGLVTTGIGVVIFYTHQKQKLHLSRAGEEELKFQFEKNVTTLQS